MGSLLLAKLIFFYSIAIVFSQDEPTTDGVIDRIEQNGPSLFGQSERGVRECVNETALKVTYEDNATVVVNCDRNRPFCDKDQNICTGRRPVPGFVCPDKNDIYPLIDNCRGFVICQDGKSYEFSCNRFERYDHSRKTCRLGGRCNTFNCVRKSGTMVPYTNDNRLYTLCLSDQPYSLEQCSLGWRFNERKQACEIECRGEGTIVDPKFPEKYYICKRGRLGYEVIETSCPVGMVYDTGSKRCSPSPADGASTDESSSSSTNGESEDKLVT